LLKIKVEAERAKQAEQLLEKIDSSILASHQQKVNSWKKNLEASLQQIDKALNSLKGDKQEQASFYLESYRLRRQNDDFSLSQVIKNPWIWTPKPKIAHNLIFGGLVGSFVGVVLAFFSAWRRGEKKSES
jgi:gas vesicle protein